MGSHSLPSNQYKALIKNILSIIGYLENKEEFANSFLKTCQQLTIIRLYKQLPATTKIKISGKLVLSPTFDSLANHVYPEISPDQYLTAFESQFLAMVEDYLIEILPDVPKSQQQQIATLLKQAGT